MSKRHRTAGLRQLGPTQSAANFSGHGFIRFRNKRTKPLTETDKERIAAWKARLLNLGVDVDNKRDLSDVGRHVRCYGKDQTQTFIANHNPKGAKTMTQQQQSPRPVSDSSTLSTNDMMKLGHALRGFYEGLSEPMSPELRHQVSRLPLLDR